MNKKLGILMDPISEIHIEKDSSFAILLAAQQRNFEIYYMEPGDIWLQEGISMGSMKTLHVQDNTNHWFDWGQTITQPLAQLDVLFMRKDPPFDIHYVYLTYLLELAESQGLFVVNKPASLRDANEKLFTAWFPACCPKTIVTSKANLLKQFIQIKIKNGFIHLKV